MALVCAKNESLQGRHARIVKLTIPAFDLFEHQTTFPLYRIAFRSDVTKYLSVPFWNAIFRGIIATEVLFRAATESYSLRVFAICIVIRWPIRVIHAQNHPRSQGLSAARVLPRPWDTPNRNCKKTCTNF